MEEMEKWDCGRDTAKRRTVIRTRLSRCALKAGRVAFEWRLMQSQAGAAFQRALKWDRKRLSGRARTLCS